MSKQIIEGVASYVKLPDGGKGLDVGCGSGALTIACAKRNPKASFTGIDRWGKEYASFSKALCENNSKAEGVGNTSFIQGDAVKLPFDDEIFDAVTSNYVYHNIPSSDRQAILLETLRTLKKGGTFAIHDIMSKMKYGDMQEFVKKLKDMGYTEAGMQKRFKSTTKLLEDKKTEAYKTEWYGSKAKVLRCFQDMQVIDYGCRGKGIITDISLFPGIQLSLQDMETEAVFPAQTFSDDIVSIN